MLGKRTQDLAGKFEDFEFRDTYYGSAFAFFFLILKNTKEIQNILQKIQNG
jgi:hypothetical protein